MNIAIVFISLNTDEIIVNGNSEEKDNLEQEFTSGLNQLIWDLGMKLPSWNDNKRK